jgi:hypothetical protein
MRPYRYVANRPLVNTDPTGLITISPVFREFWYLGNKPSDCGQRSVAWRFILERNTTKCSGYIIQELTHTTNVKDCMGKPVPPIGTGRFWEAWFVQEGDIYEERDELAGHGGMADHTDSDIYPAQPNSEGMQINRGLVGFFCAGTTGNLNQDWARGTPNHARQSGNLPSTTVEPTWWRDFNRQTGEPYAEREVRSTWCCCPGKQQRSRVEVYQGRVR